MNIDIDETQITPTAKKIIDESSYYELLHHWRFRRIGDALFEGETGKYYAKVMNEKGYKLAHEERVQISKDIGWENI